TFEKFSGADKTLTSSMKSVGEAMAIGRTFKESLQKALRSLEIGARGLGGGGKFGDRELNDEGAIRSGLAHPTAERLFYVRYAFLNGMSLEEIFRYTKIDPWFLHQIREIVELENTLVETGFSKLSPELLREAKEAGFTDKQLG